MPDNRSADGLRNGMRVRAVVHAARFSSRQKLLLLALNAWPLAHLLVAAGLFMLPSWSWSGRVTSALAWLLLLPPLLCRAVVGSGLPDGVCAVPSPTFFRWWATWQFQMLFNRLPWIDEALRFFPGVYSAWLRLWGARIGRLTLWSPGVRIFDRPLLRIGNDVVVGIDARIVGHFGSLDAEGRAIFTLGTITLGDRTSVGGSALLSAGLVLESDQATEALFLGAPFIRWRAGARVPAAENPLPSVPPKS